MADFTVIDTDELNDLRKLADEVRKLATEYIEFDNGGMPADPGYENATHAIGRELRMRLIGTVDFDRTFEDDE